MDVLFANVIVDVNVDSLNKSFVFKIPKDLASKIKPGDKVIFPFGKSNSKREGFVIEILTEEQLKNKNFYKKEKYFQDENSINNLKEILDVANKKIGVNEILLKIAIFLCKEYYCPISQCLNTVLPVKKVVRKNKRQVDAIEKYGYKDTYNDIELNENQKEIVDNILSSYDNSFCEHLIYGVTGSGKTEVYIKVIEEVLKNGKQVIVLIPEIALTHQTVIRLKRKFGDGIAIIHSRMSAGEKYIQYKKCEDGEANILIGPRSAIFAPFENLGLVVIDEVNDNSYKSENSPRYDTIDVARFRCKEQNAMLITLSATPGIVLYHNALKEGSEIKLHKLTKRANAEMPKVYIVDMKKEIRDGNKSIFSRLLVDKINDRLNKNEQIMLYMNRRGYDTIFTCKNCGETYKCPHCDVSLVSHFDGKLKCHYCGYEIDEPLTCPKCNSNEIEKYGMGTEKLEEICQDMFPKARILRMDKDTTSVKDGHDMIIDKFRNGKADILIGTQMIVKGHDFPNVTLVAVLRADLSLYRETYKASEESFSILTQCVGRSGRKSNGESVIQCYDVDNFVIDQIAEQNFEKYYEDEIKFREKLNYPPFSFLLTIKISSSLIVKLEDFAKNLKLLLDTKNDVDAVILGPTKANPEKIKDVYYRVIYIKCKQKEHAKKIRNLVQKYLAYVDKADILKLTYDIE